MRVTRRDGADHDGSPAVRAGAPPGPGRPAASLQGLQRAAGNRAVGLLVQRWTLEQVDYSPGSAEGEAAYEHRVQTGTMDAAPNVGVLWEGGMRVNSVVSAGNDLHAERLLIGGRVLPPNGLLPPNGPNFAAYRNMHRNPAVLYTERPPCWYCLPTLNQALRNDDVVRYSVPSAAPEVMTRTLRNYIEQARLHRQDEEVARELWRG